MPKKKDTTLNEDNVLQFMEGAIKKYDEMGMIADVMLWQAVLNIIKTHFVRKTK